MNPATGFSLVPWIPRLRRYARVLLRQPEDADDLVQATLERAWVKSDHWSRVTDMRAWLFSIMHNLHVDGMRRSRLDCVSLTDHAEWVPAVPAQQEQSAALLDLQTMLDQLSPSHKEVLLLVAVEELPYAQVAQMLDIPIGTVMSRLSRARAQLRQLMDAANSTDAALRRVK